MWDLHEGGREHEERYQSVWAHGVLLRLFDGLEGAVRGVSYMQAADCVCIEAISGVMLGSFKGE